MNTSSRQTTADEPWNEHAGLLPLFGLSPLLAMSNSTVSALGLGMVALLVTLVSSCVISVFRHQVLPAIRLPVFVLAIAAVATCAELLMQAYAYPLYQTLGIFVPLIVTNSVLLCRAESIASQQTPLAATLDGLMAGTRFLLLIVAFGAIRELLGTGAVFAELDHWLPLAGNWRIEVFATESPFLLALSPPGAFLLLGCLVALKQVLDKRNGKRTEPGAQVAPGSKRVRVTGKV